MLQPRSHRFLGLAVRPAALRYLALLALAVLLTWLPACSSPTSMDPKETDPGIAANLRLVESKIQSLFDELERNAAGPFSDYEAIHYRPLLDDLAKAQRLARIHDRPRALQEGMVDLETAIENFRRQHRDGKLSYSIVNEAKASLADRVAALLRMERR